MRSVLVILLALAILPQLHVNAEEDPFNIYVENDTIVHPGETISFRIAWHNIVGFERHIMLDLDSSHQNLSIEGLPLSAKRVASGLQGDLRINITADSEASWETTTFTFTATCLEISNWNETYSVDVIVSPWSDLEFGANDGSSFYVQQNVRTTLAVNVSNNGWLTDYAKINMNTSSDWNFGFTDDLNNDDELNIELIGGGYTYVNFWIDVPAVINGAPLAGTGPTFVLEAESSLDRRIINWSFSLEMQTWHNITIDSIGEDCTLSPGESGKATVNIRNNGNVESTIDATLKYSGINADRIESDGWTVALFNAFESTPLSPNESRTIEIAFEAPNINSGNIVVELIVKPFNIPERTRVINIGAEIIWERGAEMVFDEQLCGQIETTEICQVPVTVTNTGNFLDTFSLQISDSTGMNAEIDEQDFSLSTGQTTEEILLNITTIPDAIGLSPGNITLDLVREDGMVIQREIIQSITAPYIDWKWETAESEVDASGRLNVLITMRNDGNIDDGLIIKMSSSYYTEMTFIPPQTAIYESEPGSIRSFEIVDCAMGENFTFRAWANIPDDQTADGIMFLNLSAHSRLAEDIKFTYSTNSTFDAVVKDDEKSQFEGFGEAIGVLWDSIWAWKWIVGAVLVSGLMINKSIKDRRARLENRIDLNQKTEGEMPEDWLAEFHKKKQKTPEIADSPSMPSEVFTGMFQAVGGEKSISPNPVEPQLVGAASSVIDHHQEVLIKGKMDDLAHDIEMGNINKPHQANVALPDDAKPDVERTIPRHKNSTKPYPDDIDLE